MKKTNKAIFIGMSFALLSFSSSAQAGMYIMNNTPSQPVNELSVQKTQSSPKTFAVKNVSKQVPIIVEEKKPYSVVSEFSPVSHNEVTAKPVIVGPVGYAESVPLDIFLEQVSPKGWKLDCSQIICKDKVVSWHSDGRLKWMDLFYKVVSPNGEYDISFDTDASVASISYIRGTKIDWAVNGKKTLNENLLLWSKAAGWDLKWNTINGADWEIGNSFVVNGTFNDAVTSLIKAFRKKGVVLTANKFSNNIIEIKQLYSEYGF